MRGLAFTLSSDEGFVQAEWAPEGDWESFPRAWDWWLERDGVVVISLDTYSGTASLGELDKGAYRLRVRPKDVATVGDFWRQERETIFQVGDRDRVVGETELRLSRVLDRVGDLLRQRDELQRLLESALDDLAVAQSAIQVLEKQLESLKALGSQPKSGLARTAWRAVASPAVATIVAIAAIPVSYYVGIEGAQIQARATREAAAQPTDLDENLVLCLETTARLAEHLNAGSG